MLAYPWRRPSTLSYYGAMFRSQLQYHFCKTISPDSPGHRAHSTFFMVLDTICGCISCYYNQLIYFISESTKFISAPQDQVCSAHCFLAKQSTWWKLMLLEHIDIRMTKRDLSWILLVLHNKCLHLWPRIWVFVHTQVYLSLLEYLYKWVTLLLIDIKLLVSLHVYFFLVIFYLTYFNLPVFQ